MISLLSDTSSPQNPYSDSYYLGKILELLLGVRLENGWTIEEVARKAKLKHGLIFQAEQKTAIPNSREFRKWSAALGLEWEETWSAALHRR